MEKVESSRLCDMPQDYVSGEGEVGPLAKMQAPRNL